MKRQCCIYMITNNVNGRIYIGSAVDFRARQYTHLSDLRRGKHHSQKLQNAFNKYGEASFTFAVIQEVEDKSQLVPREQYWLDLHKSYGRDGYNISPTAGNCIGVKHSAETRAKISAALRNRSPSEDTRRKLSAAHKGRTYSSETLARMSAAKLNMTPEQRQEFCKKISEGKRGRKATDEERAAMSAARKGKKQSPEHIAKRAAAARGKPFSEERKLKISIALTGKKRLPKVVAMNAEST